MCCKAVSPAAMAEAVPGPQEWHKPKEGLFVRTDFNAHFVHTDPPRDLGTLKKERRPPSAAYFQTIWEVF